MPEILPRLRQPDRLEVGAQQILVGEVDPRRRDGPGDHPRLAAEEILVVR